MFAILLLLLCSSVQAAEELEEIPAEVEPFLLKDNFAISLTEGDLNRDGRPDYILVQQLYREDEDQNSEESPRPFMILIRGSDDKLSLAKRNDKVVYCEDCGGMMGDPFMGVTIKGTRFTVEHYGGSAWRWGVSFSFDYSRKENTWQLVQVEDVSFHATDPDNTREIKRSTPPRDYGKIDITDFDPQNYMCVGPK